MRFLVYRLAQKLVAGRNLYKPAERHRISLIAGWSSIGGNFLIALLKLIFGLLTNSIALMADAAHSFSDILSSLIVLIGFSFAKKEPDSEHPHGHGRSEYLAGLIIAFMLIGLSGAFIYNAYLRYIDNTPVSASIVAVVAVLISILIKEFLYNFSARISTLIESDTIEGDAWHHRSDSLSSALVLFALTGSFFGLYNLDAVLGFAIALFILYAGLKIARNSCSRLLGTAPNQDLEEGVINRAREINGVIDVHNLKVHDYGSWKVMTMHIEVNGDLNLDKAHDIAHRVEEHVSEKYHCDTIVHLDPC